MVDSLERCFANPYVSRSDDSGFLNADGSLKEVNNVLLDVFVY